MNVARRAALTSFVGRQRDLVALARTVRRARLLTLTGTGGAGKTRLAAALAERVARHYPGAVTWIDLSGTRSKASLASLLSEAIGVDRSSVPGDLDDMASALGVGRTLLVVDNCEHLIDASADIVGGLLERSPNLTVLATSREPLGLPGEVRWLVQPLSLPDPRRRLTPRDLEDFEASRLFVERLGPVRRFAPIRAEDVEPIARICHLLDGLPLAIELAAARAATLPLAEICARLDDRFRLLTVAPRTAPARQQTLKATVDWSYALLSPADRQVLARLSVFAGTFDLEAAHEIAEADLDAITRPVEKSLLVAEDDGRYRMLETLRQYAGERLEAGQRAQCAERHARHFLALAAPPGLRERSRLAALDREVSNVRAALSWAVSHQLELVLGDHGVLPDYWTARGRPGEARQWVLQALEQRPAPSRDRGRCLRMLSWVAHRQGDYETALAAASEALAVMQQVGDQHDIARALWELGDRQRHAGSLDEACSLLEQSRAAFEPFGVSVGLADALMALGHARALRGDVDRGGSQIAEARRQFESLGMMLRAGGYCPMWLGDIALARGSTADARRNLTEAMTVFRPLAEQWLIGYALAGFAWLAAREGEFERALRLAGAVTEHSTVSGLRLPPAYSVRVELGLRAARRRAGARSDALFQEGTLLDLDSTIAYALGESTWREGRRPPVAESSRVKLSRREQQVASLVTSGLTDVELAAQLGISERTAETHVAAIRNKLGFSRRSQIAAWYAAEGIRTSPDVRLPALP